MRSTTASYRSPSAHYALAWRCFILKRRASLNTDGLVAPPIRAFPAFSSKRCNSSGRESGRPKVSERQAGESNWLEREATRSSATRATIESHTRIAAAKQKSLPQATSASMDSGGADCLEAQAHWPCGHARGLNGKMPARTQRSVGS